MAVTEKCDVYSFGVVALELLMGRHPGDLLSPSSASTVQNEMMLNEILDTRLPPPRTRSGIQDVIHIASVAFACLEANPKSRPTMKFVSEEFVSRRRLTANALHSISVAELKNGGMRAVGPTQQQCHDGEGQREYQIEMSTLVSN